MVFIIMGKTRTTCLTKMSWEESSAKSLRVVEETLQAGRIQQPKSSMPSSLPLQIPSSSSRSLSEACLAFPPDSL